MRGLDHQDEPPFLWPQGLIALNAFIISTAVPIRQNCVSRLARQHAYLDLQPELRADEKSSKLIAVLEERRRDPPNVRDKVDHDADELPKPTDTGTVIPLIEQALDQLDCERKYFLRSARSTPLKPVPGLSRPSDNQYSPTADE